jgi:predicted RNA-binding protein with RPS1 domain
MRQEHPKYAALGNEGLPGFNWEQFDGGWNGVSLKVNDKIKVKAGSKDKVFSREPYAQSMYNRIAGVEIENVKDVKKGTTVAVSDMEIINDNTMSVTVGGGASNVLVDMSKENQFFRIFEYGGEKMDRQSFVKAMREDATFKEKILSTNIYVKFGTDTEKGSVWDGHVDMLNKELHEQITLGNKAYVAEILGTNGGGFVVELMGTLKAFMPGSMAASNRISDYESLVGRKMEVMVESWNPRYGFVVSRKKYLNKVRPFKVRPIQDELKKNPDKLYTGRVTGATNFGIFIELDEYITGMLHKTLASDEMRQKIREFDTVEAGTEMQVYVHAVEFDYDGNPRVIFSDVPTAERNAVIAKREAEEEKEKAASGQTEQAKGYAGYRPRQTRQQKSDDQAPKQKGKLREASEKDLSRLAAHFNK